MKIDFSLIKDGIISHRRRILVTAGVVIFFLLLALTMFFVGKSHTLLLNNTDVEVNGKLYKAFDIEEIIIDEDNVIEGSYPGIIDEILVVGQSHHIKISYYDEDDDLNQVEVSFNVPVSERMMNVSLPVLAAHSTEESLWLTHFEPISISSEEEEEVITDEFSM